MNGKLTAMNVYTIPKTAEALGRTMLTFKRWLKDGMLPAPIIKCAASGYLHYTEGEVKLIAKILRKHELEFSYFHATHTRTIEKLYQALEGYRRT